jgi:hypothetical protein
VLQQAGIELIAKVSEYDRAHLNAGQKAEVTIHAVQGKVLPATIKAVAGASRREVWSWNDPTRTFDVSFDVTSSEPRSLQARQSRRFGTCRARRSSNRTAGLSCSSAAATRSSRSK